MNLKAFDLGEELAKDALGGLLSLTIAKKDNLEFIKTTNLKIE